MKEIKELQEKIKITIDPHDIMILEDMILTREIYTEKAIDRANEMQAEMFHGEED